MSVIKYKRTGGSYLDLTAKEKTLNTKTFKVEAANAKAGKALDTRTARVSEKVSCKSRFGKAEFTLNMSVRAFKTKDPKVELENFWELSEVKVWATNLKLPMKHWCQSHITWDGGARTVGKSKTNAPSISGKLYVTVTDVMNKETKIGKPITYLPYQNTIKVG